MSQYVGSLLIVISFPLKIQQMEYFYEDLWLYLKKKLI